MNTWRILHGDVRERLRELPDGSVQTCVTSPPYWGLRDYGVSGQIGLESTPDAFVCALVEVFREVRRVLADDGTVWINLGDSYASTGGERAYGSSDGGTGRGPGARRFRPTTATDAGAGLSAQSIAASEIQRETWPQCSPKAKDLVGIPWRVAFALQADGWYLRSDIIWSKPNPMPESVTDRPTKAHEYIFLLSKSATYYFDQDAIREAHKPESLARYEYGLNVSAPADGFVNAGAANPRAIGHCEKMADNINPLGRNKRTVWTIATQPYPDAHFATFPEDLIEPCILAGSRTGDTVLDPFNGSGTTGVVSVRHGRNYVGIELNPAYITLARKRIHAVAPLFAEEVA